MTCLTMALAAWLVLADCHHCVADWFRDFPVETFAREFWPASQDRPGDWRLVSTAGCPDEVF